MKKYKCKKCGLEYGVDTMLQFMGSVYFLKNPRMLEPVPVTVPIAMLAPVMCPGCHSRKIERM